MECQKSMSRCAFVFVDQAAKDVAAVELAGGQPALPCHCALIARAPQAEVAVGTVAVAGSVRGAVPAFRRARFPGPPSEPGVPVIPAPGSPPGPLPTTVVLPLGSALPALDCQPDAGIHRRLLPCRRATAASLCPSPCAHRWRARTPTGTPPRPATTSRRRACPPPNGRGGRRRVASHVHHHHHHHHPVDEVG